MKKWQTVRRLTSKQKGEILERVRESGRFQLVRQDNGEYGFLREDGTISNFVLRRCPRCGHIDIWHTRPPQPCDLTLKCKECREYSEVS